MQSTGQKKSKRQDMQEQATQEREVNAKWNQPPKEEQVGKKVTAKEMRE